MSGSDADLGAPGGPRPFFETANAPDLRGRILLLTYHFPPGQAAGALRWQKLAHHFVAAGWGLDVITALPSDQSSGGQDRLRDLPAGIRVFGVHSPGSWIDNFERAVLSTRRLSLPIQAPSAVRYQPDERSRSRSEALHSGWSLRAARRTYLSWAQYTRERHWANAARELARRVARRHHPDVVISCGPPHMVHLAGRDVAAAIGARFIMDLRDPWSLVERLPADLGSPLWYGLAARAEARCVAAADLIAMNTAPARDAMQRAYPNRADAVIAVMNGWDPPVVSDAPPAGKPFRVAYAGSISLDRTPDDLFRAAAALAARFELASDDLELLFIGPRGASDGSEQALLDAAEAGGVSRFLRVEPFLPRREALRQLASAHVLVTLYQDSHMAIPSKVFEYLTLPGRVLAFATPSCATARALEGTDAAVVDPGDPAAHARSLGRLYEDFKDGTYLPAPPPPGLSRAAQAALFIGEIERRVPPAISTVALQDVHLERDPSATSR